MRAVRFAGARVAVEDTDEPEGEGVRVHVRSAGICGSDLGFLRTGVLSVIPGHEIAGVTDDGVPVVVQPNTVCGVCSACSAGHSNVCRSAYDVFAGVSAMNGGLAEQVMVRSEQVHRLPVGFPVELAALVEPAAVACHAVSLLQHTAGLPVVVVGGGTIGLLASVLMHRRGEDVLLLARHTHQREAARRLGIESAAACPTGLDPDAVLDAAGTQSALDLSIDVVRSHGHVVTAGSAPWAASMNEAFMYKELSLTGSIIYTTDDFAGAIDFLDSDHEVMRALVTHRFPLEEAASAFVAAAGRGKSGAIKVLIQPQHEDGV